jgi:hypothetical protein
MASSFFVKAQNCIISRRAYAGAEQSVVDIPAISEHRATDMIHQTILYSRIILLRSLSFGCADISVESTLWDGEVNLRALRRSQ